MEQAATHPEAAPAGATRRWRGTALKLAIATLLLFAAPGPMLVMALYVTAVGVLATPVVYWLRRERFPRHLRKVAVRTAFLLVACALIFANIRLADTRLHALTDAVNAYEADHGALPTELTALVPDYVDRVPRATLWLTMNRFRWHPERAMLTCIPAPPIGWFGYDFRTDSPIAMD